MIDVSNAWKNAHKERLLPETFVEITMDVANTDVSLVGLGGSNQAPFSYPARILDNADYSSFEKYAFLEQNLWLLDGSRSLISDLDDYQPPAFVSDNASSSTLVVRLSKVQTEAILGFTITWSTEFDTYATKFYLEVMSGDAVVASTEVTNNNSRVSVVDLPVSEYDGLCIVVKEWSLPNQRARIDAVMFGQKLIFTKNEIIEYSHEQTGSPLGTEITQNAIEFTVDNSDARWSLLNPWGLGSYLSERQKLLVRYGLNTGVGVEWIRAGVFYLSEWVAPSNGITATFKARDLTEFMLDAKYSRAYWTGVTSTSTTVYDDNYTEIATLEAGTTVRVYRKWIYSSSFGGEAPGPESSGLMMYAIDEGNVRYENVTITSSKKLSFDVLKAFYSCVPILDEIDTNSAIISYESPVSVEETSVAEFLQQCAASCGLTMWQDTSGVYHIDEPDTTLTDYVISKENSYSYPEIELTKPLRQIDIVYHYQHHSGTNTATYGVGNTGETIVVDCPFVWKNSTRIDNLAKKYNNYWLYREMVSGEFRADPRLELFDVVTVETKYGTLEPVMITRIKYTYNGSFRGSYEGKRIWRQT